jgi:hypothetical protein
MGHRFVGRRLRETKEKRGRKLDANNIELLTTQHMPAPAPLFLQ